MDKSELLNLLKNPNSLTSEKVEELNVLIKEYPYFQIPYFLIARHHFQSGTIEKDAAIQRASSYALDRKVLKKYITEPWVVKSEPAEKEETLNTAAIIVETTEEAPEASINEMEVSEEPNAAFQEQTLIEVQAKEEESFTEAVGPQKEDIQSEQLEETREVVDEYISPPAEIESPAEIEIVKIEEIIEEAPLPEIEKTVPSDETEETVSVKEAEAELNYTEFGTTSDETAGSAEVFEEVVLTPGDPVVSDVNVVETSPLIEEETKSNIENDSPYTDDETLNPASTLTAEEQGEETFTLDYLNSIPENPDSKPNYRRKIQDELIDRFIQSRPSLPKPAIKAASDEQEDLAEKNLMEDSNLVSENLAIIMAKQGKIEKAIDIYKKLIWKYPQKKAYFANRIEELKK